MGLFDFRQKSLSIPAAPELWGETFYTQLNTQQDNKALMAMYNDIPEVATPVNYTIDSLSIIPFFHYKGDKVIENSKVLSVIDTPNQFQTKSDFIKIYFLNRILFGAGFINRIKPVGIKDVKQLYVLPTKDTEVVLKDSNQKDFRLNEISGYKVTLNGTIISIPKNDVFTQREAAIIDNNYYSYRSRLMTAILTSDSLRYNYEARIKLLRDRGAVGIVSPDVAGSNISQDDADKMRNKFFKENGLTGRKFPFLISPRPLKFTPTSFNAGELELNANKLQDFQTICAVMGIDSSIFENSKSTYNNKILAKRNFYEDVVMPYFDGFLQFLENIFELPEGEYLKADYSNIPALQEDYEKKVNANSKAYNDGAITQAEYREAIGYQGGKAEYKTSVSGMVNQANE